MSTLSTTGTANGFAVPTSASGMMVAPDGPGAAGTAAMSIARMYMLFDKAHQALLILNDVGTDLFREVTVTEDMANYLTASFGERISLEQIRVIAGMLVQIAEGSLNLVAQGRDAAQAAAMANLQVQAIAEQLHATGADGAYVDSLRRAG